MTDYISRRSVMELVQFMPAKGGPIGMVPTKAVLRIPAADVRPVVHGRWEDRGSLSARCSECGCKSLRASHYCPACGADMRKEANK